MTNHNPYANHMGDRRWKPEEDKILREMYAAGHTTEAMAKVIKGRTAAGCKMRSLYLRSGKQGVQPKKWTAQEIELAQTLWNENASDEKFMEILGRPKRAVGSKLRRDRNEERVVPHGFHGGSKTVVPPEVLADRDRRMAEEYALSPSHRLMGDPIPSRAARATR